MKIVIPILMSQICHEEQMGYYNEKLSVLFRFSRYLLSNCYVAGMCLVFVLAILFAPPDSSPFPTSAHTRDHSCNQSTKKPMG